MYLLLLSLYEVHILLLCFSWNRKIKYRIFFYAKLPYLRTKYNQIQVISGYSRGVRIITSSCKDIFSWYIHIFSGIFWFFSGIFWYFIVYSDMRYIVIKAFFCLDKSLYLIWVILSFFSFPPSFLAKCSHLLVIVLYIYL